MRGATPRAEHKDIAVREHLDELLKGVSGVLVWEGNPSKEKKERYSYQVLGALTFPDAAVLSPFTCAFEFDREARRGSDKSSFKRALMKASVPVLSGKYDACVLIFSLQSGTVRTAYRDDNERTKELLAFLEKRGLYVALINGSAASEVNGRK